LHSSFFYPIFSVCATDRAKDQSVLTGNDADLKKNTTPIAV